jgi:hypothetical protein
MFQGDVTYTDAALKANKLSIVFEDIKASRETLERVREFVGTHPTVYLSTHCPEGYENLEMNMSKLEKTRGDRHKGLEYRVLGQAVANGLQAREGNKELVRAGMAYRRINNIHISEIENLESAVEKITRTGAGKGKNFDEMQTNLLAYHELIETVAAGSKDRKISRDDALRAYNRINAVAAAGKRYLKGKNLSDPKFAAINEIYRLAEYHTQILFDELQRGSLKRKGSSAPLDRIFSSVDNDDDDE